MLLLAVLVLQQIILHPQVLQDAEQEAHFVPMMNTSPAVIDMHPDQSEEPVMNPDDWVDEPRIHYGEEDEATTETGEKPLDKGLQPTHRHSA